MLQFFVSKMLCYFFCFSYTGLLLNFSNESISLYRYIQAYTLHEKHLKKVLKNVCLWCVKYFSCSTQKFFLHFFFILSQWTVYSTYVKKHKEQKAKRIRWIYFLIFFLLSWNEKSILRKRILATTLNMLQASFSYTEVKREYLIDISGCRAININSSVFVTAISLLHHTTRQTLQSAQSLNAMIGAYRLRLGL